MTEQEIEKCKFCGSTNITYIKGVINVAICEDCDELQEETH